MPSMNGCGLARAASAAGSFPCFDIIKTTVLGGMTRAVAGDHVGHRRPFS